MFDTFSPSLDSTWVVNYKFWKALEMRFHLLGSNFSVLNRRGVIRILVRISNARINYRIFSHIFECKLISAGWSSHFSRSIIKRISNCICLRISGISIPFEMKMFFFLFWPSFAKNLLKFSIQWTLHVMWRDVTWLLHPGLILLLASWLSWQYLTKLLLHLGDHGSHVKIPKILLR